MYNNDVIELLKKTNIVDVVEETVKLYRNNGILFGLCPFHKERTPSFSVNPSTQTFQCFGCGIGGNVISFIMMRDNCSFEDAVTKLAIRAGVENPENKKDTETEKKKNRLYQINDLACAYFYQKGKNSEDAKQYLKKRGLSDATIKKFNLGMSGGYFADALSTYLSSKGCTKEEMLDAGLISQKEESDEYHDKFWNRIMFPIFNANNKIVGFGGRILGEGKPKYLNSPETIIFDKSHELYGLHIAKTKNKPFILCEGYLDVISMHQAGFQTAVASLGTALTYAQAEIIKKYTNTVFIAYDSDTPGLRATARAISILEEVGLRVFVATTAPFKDVDELLQKGAEGTEEMKKRIREAVHGRRFLIEQLKTEKGDDLDGFYDEAVKHLL